MNMIWNDDLYRWRWLLAMSNDDDDGGDDGGGGGDDGGDGGKAPDGGDGGDGKSPDDGNVSDGKSPDDGNVADGKSPDDGNVSDGKTPDDDGNVSDPGGGGTDPGGATFGGDARDTSGYGGDGGAAGDTSGGPSGSDTSGAPFGGDARDTSGYSGDGLGAGTDTSGLADPSANDPNFQTEGRVAPDTTDRPFSGTGPQGLADRQPGADGGPPAPSGGPKSEAAASSIVGGDARFTPGGGGAAAGGVSDISSILGGQGPVESALDNATFNDMWNSLPGAGISPGRTTPGTTPGFGDASGYPGLDPTKPIGAPGGDISWLDPMRQPLNSSTQEGGPPSWLTEAMMGMQNLTTAPNVGDTTNPLAVQAGINDIGQQPPGGQWSTSIPGYGPAPVGPSGQQKLFGGDLQSAMTPAPDPATLGAVPGTVSPVAGSAQMSSLPAWAQAAFGRDPNAPQSTDTMATLPASLGGTTLDPAQLAAASQATFDQQNQVASTDTTTLPPGVSGFAGTETPAGLTNLDLTNPDQTPVAGQKGPYAGIGPGGGPGPGTISPAGGVSSAVETFPVGGPQTRGDVNVTNPPQGGTIADTNVPLPQADPRGRLPSGGFAADPGTFNAIDAQAAPQTRVSGGGGGVQSQPSPGGTVGPSESAALSTAPADGGGIPSDTPSNTSGLSGGGGGAGGASGFPAPLTPQSLIAPIPGGGGTGAGTGDGTGDGGPNPPAPDGGSPPFAPPNIPLQSLPENFEEGMWATPNPAGGLAVPQTPFQPPPNMPIPNDLNIINGRPQVPLPAPDGSVNAALNNATDTGP